MERLLSDSDIKSALNEHGKDAMILTYNELAELCDEFGINKGSNFDGLDQLIESLIPLILLYEVDDKFGHWTCIFESVTKVPKVSKFTNFDEDFDGDFERCIEFFDSLGFIPDDELRRLNYGGNDSIILNGLAQIKESGTPVVYNSKKLQSRDPGINTCGRWVLARLLTSDMPLETFQKMMNNDMVVTEMTDFVLSQ